MGPIIKQSSHQTPIDIEGLFLWLSDNEKLRQGHVMKPAMAVVENKAAVIPAEVVDVICLPAV